MSEGYWECRRCGASGTARGHPLAAEMEQRLHVERAHNLVYRIRSAWAGLLRGWRNP